MLEHASEDISEPVDCFRTSVHPLNGINTLFIKMLCYGEFNSFVLVNALSRKNETHSLDCQDNSDQCPLLVQEVSMMGTPSPPPSVQCKLCGNEAHKIFDSDIYLVHQTVFGIWQGKHLLVYLISAPQYYWGS